MTRRVIWAVIAVAAVGLGIAVTPLVPNRDLFKLWLAVCMLVAGSIAGIYYEARRP